MSDEIREDSAAGPDDYAAAAYKRYASTAYGRLNSKSDQAARSNQFQGVLQGLLPSDRKAPMLEAGCGQGFLLRYLLDEGYQELVGVDLSPEQVAACREGGLDFVEQCSVEDYLKKSPKTFERVLCFDVLEHVPKTQTLSFLRSLRAALSPTGKVLIRVPNMGHLLGLRGRYIDFTHEVGFTDQSLEQVLQLAGFEDIRLLSEVNKTSWKARLRARISNFVHKLTYWLTGVPRARVYSKNLMVLAG